MLERFIHKKSLGQHFLNSDFVPEQMCQAAAVTIGDTVLEIGPGTGALTKVLLERGATVIAVEADERAIASLETTFTEAISQKRLLIHHMDARKLDFAVLGLRAYQFKVVANIPYYLSGLLFRQLLDTRTQPHTLVFLVQKELAIRIARDPKESLLSLSVKLFGTPKYVNTIKRGHFTPPPNVDSAIIAVTAVNQDNFRDFTSVEAFSILHEAFKSKRKQLVGNLQDRFSREVVLTAVTTLGLPADIRAEDIPLSTWIPLITTLLSHE